MSKYTYFILTPGCHRNAYVKYPNGTEGVYIKFGDESSSENNEGLRKGYTTHNPDIGVSAIMENENTERKTSYASDLRKKLDEYLGGPVPSTREWFSVERMSAWKFFEFMKNFDKKTMNDELFNKINKKIEDIFSIR